MDFFKTASGLIFIILIIVIIYFVKTKRSRCPKCRQKNTMKEYKREAIRKSKRSQDLGNGRKRYYSLVTYKVTYKCEKCGATLEKTESREED